MPRAGSEPSGRAWTAVPLSALVLAGCGAPQAIGPGAGAPALPATGRTADGIEFRVTVGPTFEQAGPGRPPVAAWCPRVDLEDPGRGRPTHGAVGCRPIRPHVPTGGYVMFCRSSEVFVLLLSGRATHSVSVLASAGPTVALTRYTTDGLDGRFWFAHYRGTASPRAVTSVEGARRNVQRYPEVRCLDRSRTNGLLGR